MLSDILKEQGYRFFVNAKTKSNKIAKIRFNNFTK
jgi:hypothetical protein